MGFAEIISLIMQILAFIAGLFAPKVGVRAVSYRTQPDCAAVEWAVPPTVSSGVFSGTVSVRCRFDAAAGGGISALRKHLVRQVPIDGQAGEAYVSNYQGLPALSWRSRVEMQDGAEVLGTTFIGSNGSSFLRSVFESSSVRGSGSAQYLQTVSATLEVQQIDGMEYELTASQAMSVKKPFFFSSARFRNQVVDQAEKSILERAESAVQEMASHL
jgi:hypothetical protein